MNRIKKVTGIYLAAGSSSRMGVSKLNLFLGNDFLGSWALKAALKSNLQKMILVVNRKESEAKWLQPFIKKTSSDRIKKVVSERSTLGQAESLKRGCSELSADDEAFMILLADQPFVTTNMINQLLDVYQYSQNVDNHASFVASRNAAIPRPPVLFDKSILPIIQKLHGDSGAKHLLKDFEKEGIYVDFNDPWLFFDIDTTDDFEKAQRYKGMID